MKKIHLALFIVAIALLSACTRTSTITFSDASVLAFRLSHDSMPNLSSVTFKVITQGDSGFIYNVDSIDYDYDLSKVVLSTSFLYRISASAVSYPADVLPSSASTDLQPIDSTINLNGSGDTINAAVSPFYLLALSSDNKNLYKYRVQVNQHKVDPYLYVWEKVQEDKAIFDLESFDLKVVCLKNVLYLFVQDGFKTTVYSSSDKAVTWSNLGSPTTLPATCKARNILCANKLGKLYYANGDKVYTSENATTWQEESYSSETFTVENMLYEFNDSIWCLAKLKDDGKYQMANTKDGKFALCGEVLPDNFPVSDYAALSFESASNRKRALIFGGYDKDGNNLNACWSVEYSTTSGYRMVDFTNPKSPIQDLTGMSIISYNKQLMLFGGVDKDMNFVGDDIFVSDNEGFTWQKTNTEKNRLPESYRTQRQKQTVVVDDDHYIYVIGGQNKTTCYSDVYRGRLNSIDW
ncbi:MAG: hypothetical protein II502_04270 [Paludibacteraceae bacterium]|nr:hypothetical protein [Paludibacteraceae bacterium]